MRKRVFALVLALMLGLGACGGKIDSGLSVEYSGSNVYTEEEVQDAADVVIRHLRMNFSGCTMTALRQQKGEDSDGAAWQKIMGQTKGIVLTSDFDVDASGGDGSLNPNSTYTSWQWILVRDNGGSWGLKTWGYG